MSADAMFRTCGKIQKFEQAFLKLQEMGPSITLYVSATPTPFMLDLVADGTDSSSSKKECNEIFCHEPGDDYAGFEDVKPLQNNDGDIFLQQNAGEPLNVNSFYENIPYANEKLMALYDDALSDPVNCKGILVIDCSDTKKVV